MNRTRQVTELLGAARTSETAAAELLPFVYDELRSLASALFAEQRRAHTLQPTALVHEAFLRLVGADVSWESRRHFLVVASRAMRNVLADHARKRRAEKRGGALHRVTLSGCEEDTSNGREVAIDDLDLALERLERFDPHLAHVVELRFLGGLTIPETAEALALSSSKIDLDWRTARAWLRRELEGCDGA